MYYFSGFALQYRFILNNKVILGPSRNYDNQNQPVALIKQGKI